MSRNLFPKITAYHHEWLKVSETHELYLELSGNPDGIPVLPHIIEYILYNLLCYLSFSNQGLGISQKTRIKGKEQLLKGL